MEQPGIISTLEFKKDGSLRKDVNGATKRMRWNLVDYSTLIVSTGVGPDVEVGFVVSDSALSVTMDDSTAAYIRVEK